MEDHKVEEKRVLIIKGTKFHVGSEALQMCAFSSSEGAGNSRLPKFRMAVCRV